MVTSSTGVAVQLCEPQEVLTEARVRAVLEQDAAAGRIVAVRFGKISLKHYAEVLGCTRTALEKFSAVFKEFEYRCDIATGPLQRLEEMRVFLELMYENRELGIRGGKITRTEFMENFQLQGSSYLHRYPAIRELIEEYDERAVRDGYLPAAQLDDVARLRRLLARGPKINTDGVTLNLEFISKKLKLSKFIVQYSPLRGIIEDWEANRLSRVQGNKLIIFIHGRIFSFEKLIEKWKEPFARRVSSAFEKLAASRAEQTAKSYYRGVSSALNWMEDNSSINCQIVLNEASTIGKVLSSREWEEALFEYREYLASRVAAGAFTAASCNASLNSLTPVLDALFHSRAVPEMSVPLPGIGQAKRLGGHLRSVAEVTRSHHSSRNHRTDYLAFARERLTAANALAGTELRAEDSSEFLSGLMEQLRSVGSLPDNPAAAVLFVLNHRLDALRNQAAAILDQAILDRRRGNDLMARASINGPWFEDAYFCSGLSRTERVSLVREYFPRPPATLEGQSTTGCANLLSLIEQTQGGIPPSCVQRGSERYGQFFEKRYLDFGGVKTVEPMLIPTAETVGAILTLYLLESGSNVTVGRTLNRDCIQESDVAGYRRVTGFKARARGRPIIVDLSAEGDAVRGIEWLAGAGIRLSARAGGDADRLFLMRIGTRVQLMTQAWYAKWFRNFSQSIESLKGLRLLPSMLRPSVLLQAALSNDGRLAAGIALGQHGAAVSQGYQQKWPTRSRYDDNIRKFQDALESVVVGNIGDAAVKLGITKEEFSLRLDRVAGTGFGTFCLDRRGRDGERGTVCTSLDCWNDCPHMIIVAEVEAVAILQLWQASLRSAQPEWERDRPERWDQVWLPWLCLVDVVEEKMARGKLVSIWRAAQKRAVEISQQVGYVPPSPF